MKQALLRNTRSYLSHPIFQTNLKYKKTSLLSLSSPSLLKLRFFTSKNDSSIENPNQPLPETNFAQTQNKDVPVDVSNKELKMHMEKYFDGDEEAIPSIFESILKMKLTGKHDESGDDLVNEFWSKPPEDVSDKEFDSDSAKPLDDVSDKEFDSDSDKSDNEW